MVDRLERFLSSKKKRYLLGFTGAGLALGLSVLATDTNLLARDLSVHGAPKKVSKELVGAKDTNATIQLFTDNVTQGAKFTASYDLTGGQVVRLRLDNAKWGNECNSTNCVICYTNSSNQPEKVASYWGLGDDGKTLIFDVESNKFIRKGILYFFSVYNGTHNCTGNYTINATINRGTTSDVNVTLELGQYTDSTTKLIELVDQYSLASITKSRATIDANDNTKFTGGNTTSPSPKLKVDNATGLNATADKFNATLALDKFPNWLNNVTVVNATNGLKGTFNATNYTGLDINDCSNGTYEFTFTIKGDVSLYPEKIGLNKFEIKKVDGADYTKDLLGTYSGDKTLLEVDYEGITLYIPRFAQAASGKPSTTIFLMSYQPDVEVKVCKFDNTCYNATISIDNRGISLYQRDPNLQRFLNGYYGALRLHLIKAASLPNIACYAIFTRADGTSLRVPCLTGGGAEQ